MVGAGLLVVVYFGAFEYMDFRLGMYLIPLEDLLQGLAILPDWRVHLVLLIGAVVGMIFGAAPGLTAPAGVALFLPLTYDMGLDTSMALLLGIYASGYFAGSIRP